MSTLITGTSMSLFLIASTIDPASQNIKNHLLEQTCWTPTATFDQHPVYQHTTWSNVYLLTITTRKIYREHLDTEIKTKLHFTPSQLIFLSRHTSKMKKPTLTVHPLGNYGPADFGGQPHALVPSAPRLMTSLLRTIHTLQTKSSLHFDVCYEVTHHGPYLDTPTLFVEVGSSEVEWNQPEPARIIAQALLTIIPEYRQETDLPDEDTVLIGIGGGHYAPRFTDIILEKHAAFGHMIPSYQINAGHITKEMLQQAIMLTPNHTAVYIHRKGLKKPQIRYFKNLAETINIPSISSTSLTDLY